MTIANAFEILSEGRIIDLGSRLSPIQIERMGDYMRRTCPDCQGTGMLGAAGILTPEGLLMIPIPCDLCNGSGLALFFSRS